MVGAHLAALAGLGFVVLSQASASAAKGEAGSCGAAGCGLEGPDELFLMQRAGTRAHLGLLGRVGAGEGGSGSLQGAGGASGWYPNVTLQSEAIAVTWFLPAQQEESVAYYNSSRFDWSTMIGNVQVGDHTVFPSNFWRSPSDPNWQKPHDPANPEAGMGLASEFGCGSDGASCEPGWGKDGPSNGVLGYEEALSGEPFLKIGVGKLLKGSCPSCTDDGYKFNSPYKFAEWPVWTVSTGGANDFVEMLHEASLDHGWGYRLKVRMSVDGNALVMEKELANIGNQTFSTPQYTHNFLSVDSHPIGPPLQLTFALNVSDYTEPGVESQWAWAKPLAGYFTAIGANTLEAIAPESPLSADPPRIKAELRGRSNLDSKAAYTASFGGVTVASELTPSQTPLYAYNLYVETATASPEPFQLVSLIPGATASWQQRLFFGEFESVGGSDSACRGAKSCDNQPGYYVAHSGVKSLNDCKALCLTRSDCVGIEYNLLFGIGRCEVWTRRAGIQAVKSMPGFVCLRRVV